MTFRDTTQIIDEPGSDTTTEQAPVDLAKIDTLHELLALAIGDFRKVLADDRYAIDMSTWHEPGDDADDRCHVCLAGSVLAKTIKLPLHDNAEDSFKGPAAWDRLFALNSLRIGDVVEAACNLHRRDRDAQDKINDAYTFAKRESIQFPYEIANPTDREGGYALLERLEDLQHKLKAAGL